MWFIVHETFNLCAIQRVSILGILDFAQRHRSFALLNARKTAWAGLSSRAFDEFYPDDLVQQGQAICVLWSRGRGTLGVYPWFHHRTKHQVRIRNEKYLLRWVFERACYRWPNPNSRKYIKIKIYKFFCLKI